LHALVDRILDVTLAHLLIARERLAIRGADRLQSHPHSPGIVNTLPLKEVRLLAGGEAKIGGTLSSVIFSPTMLGVTAPTAQSRCS